MATTSVEPESQPEGNAALLALIAEIRANKDHSSDQIGEPGWIKAIQRAVTNKVAYREAIRLAREERNRVMP